MPKKNKRDLPTVNRFDKNDKYRGEETEKVAEQRNTFYWTKVAELHEKENTIRRESNG